MNGYYKNWYQHYQEVEKQKKQDEKRGYYSNLAEKSEQLQTNEAVITGRRILEKDKRIIHIPNSRGRFKKNKGKGLLLPVITVLGFIFLWYQMDLGSVRDVTNEVLVFARIREDATQVMNYHTSLLDQHTEFSEKVAAYVIGEDETDFETLQLLYDEIRTQHTEMARISGKDYEDALSLWSDKLSSMNQMMQELELGEDLHALHEQFAKDQAELTSLIRLALGLDD